MKKERLDKLLVLRGMVSSRERAQALIMEGKVLVDGTRVDKAAALVSTECALLLKGRDLPYVSRGGLKLEKALKVFRVDAEGKTCMDVGASTGGFTDCLLKKGAKKVYAVDVGYGQLAWSLKQDPRVVSLERRNIRYLSPGDIGELADLAVIDTSFISLKKVLPTVMQLIKEGGEIIALIKPQFEVGKGRVGKGGVVKDKEDHAMVIGEISRFATGLGLKELGLTESPLLGPKGNREFFIYLKKGLGIRDWGLGIRD
jgi:23S rRNA (cytidine1920-2'-O)/16S rRNA (cytidine1409-2'-O)-methyltransferase